MSEVGSIYTNRGILTARTTKKTGTYDFTVFTTKSCLIVQFSQK